MRAIWNIARRDLQSLFLSLKAYVVTTLLLLIFGLFFYLDLAEAHEASMRDMFRLMSFMFLFIVPIITMGALADERRSGTLELLLTCPINRFQVIAGKFLAAAAFYTFVVALTIQFYLLMCLSGRPDPGPVFTGYIGLLLSGYLFIAVGIYASSLTKSPLVAALVSYCLLILWFMTSSMQTYFSKNVGELIGSFGIIERLASFERGLIQTSDISFFVIGTIFWLMITTAGFTLEQENPLV